MKYDDASWYLEGDSPKYPTGTPEVQAFVMPGIYLAWAIQNNLTDKIHSGKETTKLLNREITPAEYLKICDGVLADGDFTELGNKFAEDYYNGEDGNMWMSQDSRYNQFTTDYFDTFNIDEDSLYTVPNTWDSYDLIAKLFDQRLAEWNSGR